MSILVVKSEKGKNGCRHETDEKSRMNENGIVYKCFSTYKKELWLSADNPGQAIAKPCLIRQN